MVSRVLLVSILLASLFSACVSVYAGESTFGGVYGANSDDIGNTIRGSIFSAPANGTVTSISAYVYISSGAPRTAKCAIYYSNLTLAGYTYPRADLTATGGPYIYSFDLETPVNIIAEQEYILTIWGYGIADYSFRVMRGNGNINQGYYDSETYAANFPDPLVPTNNNYEYSIWATYTETSGEYNYIFHGLFDENSGVLKDAGERAVNVTAYWSDGTVASTFEVNATNYQAFATSPQYFVFDLGSVNREYWLSPAEGDAETVNIYIFNATLAEYTVSFVDYTGALSVYSWVTANRYINGTLFVMDKRKVDSQSKVVAALQIGKTYTIKVEAASASPYTWGDLTTTLDGTIELIVKGMEFPVDIELTYRYVRAYGYRYSFNETLDSITHVYLDTKENTYNATIYIYDSDNVLVNSYLYSDTDSFSYTWSEAAVNDAYHSVVVINHGDYGVLVFKQVFGGVLTDTEQIDVSFLGSVAGVDMQELFPTAIIIVLATCFSAATAGIGGIIVVMFAGAMTWIGWWSLDINLLAFTGILAVIYAVTKNYHRVQGE